MGRSRIFSGQRRPLAEVPANAVQPSSGNMKTFITSGWRSSSLTSSSQYSSSISTVGTTATAPSTLRSDDSLRSWFANKTRPLRGVQVPIQGRSVSGSAVTGRGIKPLSGAVGARPRPRMIPGRKVILELSPAVSLRVLLAQVCGGALESIVRQGKTIELHFVHNISADRFYRFACSGQFVVLGARVLPEIPTTTEPLREPRYEKMIMDGARRTIKMYRYVNPTTFCTMNSRVQIDQLKDAFSCTGAVLDVQPMFARMQIAYIIHYEAVRPAILAKQLFERGEGPFRQYKGWTVEYVRDPVDRPCSFA